MPISLEEFGEFEIVERSPTQSKSNLSLEEFGDFDVVESAKDRQRQPLSLEEFGEFDILPREQEQTSFFTPDEQEEQRKQAELKALADLEDQRNGVQAQIDRFKGQTIQAADPFAEQTIQADDRNIFERAKDKLVAKFRGTVEEAKELPLVEKTKRIGKNLATGVGGTTKSFGDFLQIVGAEKVGKSISDFSEEQLEKVIVEDPNFADEVMQGLGSSLVFFVPGLGAAGLSSKVLKGAPKVAAALGISLTSLLESMTEGGAEYTESIRQGKKPEEAEKDAFKVFGANVPITVVSNLLGGIFSSKGNPIKRALRGFVGEGSQEAIQGATSSLVGGGFDDLDPKQLGKEFAIGGIIGSGLGALTTPSAQSRAQEEALGKLSRGELLTPQEESVVEEILQPTGVKQDDITQDIQRLPSEEQIRQDVKDNTKKAEQQREKFIQIKKDNPDVKFRGDAGERNVGLINLTDDFNAAAAYQRGGLVSQEDFEADVRSGKYAELLSKVKAFKPNVENTLDATDFAEIARIGLLDSKNNVEAQEIIDAANDRNVIYFWEFTKPKYQQAWNDVLIPQLRTRGYDSIKYNDDVATGTTLAVFSREQLKEIKTETTKIPSEKAIDPGRVLQAKGEIETVPQEQTIETQQPITPQNPKGIPKEQEGVLPIQEAAKETQPATVIGKFLKKNFTSKGNLPKDVFDAKISKDGFINRELKLVQQSVKDLEIATKEVTNRSDLSDSPKLALKVDSALKGDIDINELSEPLRAPVRAMRDHIDNMSRRLIEEGAVEGKLTPVLQKNLGTYVKRSYRVHTDPDWAKKVPEEVRNKAKAFIRQELQGPFKERGAFLLPPKDPVTEAEVNGLIDELLYKFDGPISILSKGSKLGSKNLSILKKRKGIPQEIRQLWGEIKDPVANYSASMANMAQLLGNHKFLSEVKEKGLGKFLHEAPIVKGDQSFSSKFATEGSKTMAPLNGLYTSKEVKQAFEDALEVEQVPPWLKTYMRINGIVKYSKTIGSVMTHIRNSLSNIGFATAQGHINVKKAPKAFKGVMTDIVNKGSQEYKDYVLKLQGLRVIGDNVRSGELRDTLKDAQVDGVDHLTEKKRKSIISKGARLAETAYSAEDDIWKIYAFENELARYKQALPDVPLPQLEKHVAEIVRNTLPTYSLVPSAIKKLRRFPFVGAFVSFPSEVIRTTYNTVNQINKELKNPKLRKIGAQRLAGSFVAASATGIASIALKALTGISDDDDNDLRRYLPPWSKNSQILWFGREDNGKIKYVDVGYTDPFSYLKNPIIAFMRGQDFKKAAIDAGIEAFSPFLSEDIFTQKVLDVTRNSNRAGKPIYNPRDDIENIALDVSKHFYDAIEPGTISSMRRIAKGISGTPINSYGKVYDPKLESLAVVSGHRLSKLDIQEAFRFKTLKAKKDFVNAVLVGKIDEGDKKIKAMMDVFNDYGGDIQAAIRLGVTPSQLREAAKDAGMSMVRYDAALLGNYERYVNTHIREKIQKLKRRRTK